MDCIDCPKASDCHHDILNDMQIIMLVLDSLDHNRIEMAKDELVLYQRRLKNRNLILTGRQ